jgi:hypothetical protein
VSAKHLIPIDDQEPAVSFWADIIQAHSAPGDVVLVPFAGDATIARAALERRRRVVLLVRTPAQQLRLWGSLVPIDDAAKRRALARLAATSKRDTPLDLYIQNLYQTTCPHCDEPASATAFIWDPARQAPVEKELTCVACGFQGRGPADESDAERTGRFERRGLSFWFILEWLVDAQDRSGREIARRHLDEYSPRNLTALADITRKIDAELSDDPTSQHVLRLWLLHALDAGRQQPDPLDPARIIERNIWHLLTQAPAADALDTPIRMAADLEAFFHEFDPAPDVGLAAGPIRRLARQLPVGHIALMLGAPPALDVDVWTWERLWSRWVFGRGEAGGLQPPVGGWARHVRALGATMSALVPALRPDGRVVFRFGDDDPDRAAAVLAAMAPYAPLDDFVYQPPLMEPAHLFDAAGGTYQMAFTPTSPVAPSPLPDAPALAEIIERAAVDAAADLIAARAEPLTYGWVATAAMTHLSRSGLLHHAMIALEADISPLAFARQHVRQGLRTALSGGVLTAPSSGLRADPSSGLRTDVAGDKPTHWWLPEPSPAEPLAERVEETVIDLLNRVPAVRPVEVYRHFPGWLTPEAELVRALLAAYGKEIEPGVWGRRAIDPAERPAIADALHRLGKRLGFSVGTGIADVVWGEGGHATHAFRIVETGRWSELGIDVLPESVVGYLVLPDRLVDLLRVKLMRNPLWRRELAERRWSPIKARHLQAMAGAPDVDRQEFKKIVGLSPIIEQAEAQIPLF